MWDAREFLPRNEMKVVQIINLERRDKVKNNGCIIYALTSSRSASPSRSEDFVALASAFFAKLAAYSPAG
jgi:hypothetical protein